MSSSRSNQGRPFDDSSSSIMTGTFNKEAWVKEFTGYFNTMRKRNPDYNHPNIEWMRLGFSQILLDSATLSHDIKVTVKNAVADIVGSPIADLKKKLDEYTKCHSVTEINSRQVTLN